MHAGEFEETVGECACVNVEAKELKHLDVSLLALRVYWDKSQQTCTFLRCILEMTHVTGSRPLAVFLLDTPHHRRRRHHRGLEHKASQ